MEPTLPRHIDLAKKREMYKFSAYPIGDDGKPAPYPPHLQTVPREDEVPNYRIFSALGLAESAVLIKTVVPDTFLGKTADWILEKVRGAVAGNPQAGPTLRDAEDYNRRHRKSGTDIARGDNIGLLPDWFSDRRFADQSLTGTNPTTIARAPPALLAEFVEAARAGGYDAWAAALPAVDPAELFVQDCSYFRAAVGAAADAELYDHQPTSNENWACAAVTLFRLHADGRLHPVAITTDYRGRMADSVTIFNRRRSPDDPTDGEATDWPWRYAKTCAQVSDWLRHELTVHLTHAHFVEEAIIVATNRAVPMDHVVFRALQPHWYKTLSLNAAGRDTLVPQVIRDIIGLTPDQASALLRHGFDTFDFVGGYVPNQLAARGFPATEEGLAAPRYRNYAYARDVLPMWFAIRRYVDATLRTHYRGPTDAEADALVAADPHVADWCREVQTAGWIRSFPTVRTLAALADAVTMCIHVAAPFHSAVNYLQNFYQAFVAARPPALCHQPPASLAELRAYREGDLVAALPLGRQREWLLASQIPWLLSFRVASDRSLLNFALSQWHVYRRKTRPEDVEVRDIALRFYTDLCGLARTFLDNSRAMDEGSIPYMVLQPGYTAVSVLI